MDGLILAGGRSTRMGGKHKGDLRYEDQTFLERIIGEFASCAERIWISYGTEMRRDYPGCVSICDEYPGCGPMGGIHAGLKRCRSDYMMVAACDMPFVKMELYHLLENELEKAQQESEAVYVGAVPVADGRVHPLAAVYKKELAGCLKEQIERKEYRIRSIFDRQNILYVDVSRRADIKRMLSNVNTAAEYEEILNPASEDAAVKVSDGKEKSLTAKVSSEEEKSLTAKVSGEKEKSLTAKVSGEKEKSLTFKVSGEKEKSFNADIKGEDSRPLRQKIVAVCGIKNSGKTTLLEKLVAGLDKRGMKVAVIKHDGHDFACDIPGTDSYRLSEAGAYGTAVFSEFRSFVHKKGTNERAKDLIQYFPEADIIFVEGMKDSRYPKIEVIREGVSVHPASNQEGRFLIVTDRDPGEYQEQTAGFGEIDRIIGMVLALFV